MKKSIITIFSIFIFFTVQGQQFLVEDIFGRDLTGETIQLVDWEGYMANPAIKLNITPPTGVSFPITLTLTANQSRLYFNEPSTVGFSGPSKSFTFSSANTQEVFMSIFPDRGDGNEDYLLTLQSSLGTQTYSINVIDQDPSTPIIDFNITFDYSEDTNYNFFGNKEKVIAEQAANDWAYFLQDMNFDQVGNNNAQIVIFNDNYNGGFWVGNSTPYSGFYLFLYGLHVDPHISGGAPSSEGFQTKGGIPTGLRKSGAYNADSHGNFNALGWNTSITDDTWYLGTNEGEVANDLYSIALHEIGHAITFNPGYTQFNLYKLNGFIDNAEVVNYHGGTVPINSPDHLNGSENNQNFVVDRISKRGVFGSEYAPEMPFGRWLITKLNLLVMQAIGYNIKSTSAFEKISVTERGLSAGIVDSAYSEIVSVSGGIPFYKFSVSEGTLPNGLDINSFTGEISGIPSQTGTFNFTIEVKDYDMKSTQKPLSIYISSVSTSLNTLHSDKYEIGEVFPNPVIANTASLGYNIPQSKEMNIELITLNGYVIQKSKYRYQKGNQTIHFNVSNLSSGVYLLKFSNNEIAMIRKFVKM